MNTRNKTICFILLLIFVSGQVLSQTDDKSRDTLLHSPKRATLYSAMLPGLGQAYNKKYWKIPVIYAAFGVTGYFFAENQQNYRLYKQAFRFRIDDNPETNDEFIGIYTDDNLKVLRDYYRRNMELNVIIGFAIYALNIIDAAVDAHLFYFDVSDELSLNIQPAFSPPFQAGPQWTGVKFTLKF
jgi:hypothetical protein